MQQDIRESPETILGQDMYLGTWQFRDGSDTLRRLEFDSEGITVDEQLCIVEVVEGEHDAIRFVGHSGAITCTPQALCEAFAGRTFGPGAKKVGILIAEHMQLWDRLRHWRYLLLVFQGHIPASLDSSMYQLIPPRPRLDPFVEEVLNQCGERVLRSEVGEMAILLRRDPATIATWLKEHGKHVIELQAEPRVDQRSPDR